MRRDSGKKNKSTSKYRKFKVSPLIAVIAMIEVLVLIAVSSYAWYIMSASKSVDTGTITVDADSGLDIDFKNANYNDNINIWDHVTNDFAFEPMTSLDGRNLFIPTSGTFGNDTTNESVFRDVTVNDINTKYLNIDFMLTNTANETMRVYLNNNSKFQVKTHGQDDREDSKALRLAFYTNDGSSGKVDSTLLTSTNNENAAVSTSDSMTIYFMNTSNWGSVNAYVWSTSGSTGNDHEYITSWPGAKMTRVAGKVYSYTFSNPFTDDTHTTRLYDRIKFSNNGGSETSVITLSYTNAGQLYNNGSWTNYTTQTIYFRPNFSDSNWDGDNVYIHVYGAGDFTSWPGDKMTNIGGNIYSYTCPTSYTTVNFNNGKNSNQSGARQSNNTSISPNTLYYSNSYSTNFTCSSTSYTPATDEYKIYFYNSRDFSDPYVKFWDTDDNVNVTYQIAMTYLSGNVYYATVPKIYDSLMFEDGENQTSANKKTQTANVSNGYIYRPTNANPSTTGYYLESFSYDYYAGSGSYAVISPGVSVGFQRAYSPVVATDANGHASRVVPAFASSIDNYIMGSGSPLFEIEPGHMLNLSMIVWLEGTDPACTASAYSGKEIELKLEFSTNLISRADAEATYTYRFYDETRELWTSNRLPTSSGVTVAPVMQLYDMTIGRGYLMHAGSTTDVNGTSKVDMWECEAPQSAATEGHDLAFRRVNPYTEEVWNYWHAGQCGSTDENKGVYDGFLKNGIISFTAFADGAPPKMYDVNYETMGGKDPTAPAKSCGGLWGTYETDTLIALDGTRNHSFSIGGADNRKGAMTIRYTYNYPGIENGTNPAPAHTIEYKASGAYNGVFYYFVVPKNIISGETSFKNSYVTGGYTFVDYNRFNDGYAMNLNNRNGNIQYKQRYNISGQMIGKYAMITTKYVSSDFSNSTSVENSYFGTDFMYFMISNARDDGQNKSDMTTDGCMHRMRFINSSDSCTREAYFLTGTYFNDKYDNGYETHLCVVPSDAAKLQGQRSNSTFNGSNNYTETVNYVSTKNKFGVYGWNGSGSNNIRYFYDTALSSWRVWENN